MLKRSKIFLNLTSVCLLLIFTGCVTVPDGTPPERVVQIHSSAENGEPLSMKEALNLMSTELAVNVFSKFKGNLNVLFKNNPDGDDITRRLYGELKMFLPIRSVLRGQDFIIESSFRKLDADTQTWYLRLKDNSGKILWSSSVNVNNEVADE